MEHEKLEELNRLKSFYVSSVSHDLKTPLTSIKLFSQLLQNMEGINPESVEYLKIIDGESNRLTRLIDNVLDYTKIEKGIKEYLFVDIELNNLVKEVMASVEYPIKMEKFDASVNLCAEDIYLSGDKDAIAEALINLISNAIKYSRERKKITVSTEFKDSYACLKVEDEGIGISKENIKLVFDEYYQIKKGKSNRTRGAGIGLAVVKHIMDAHKGKIQVESEVGKGSSFYLLFPLRENE
ncbi:MAG: HAMP domain-containing histidine kinase [Bacteroidetes bacterium]|nr:HAMP domain-containing histidine kinase [Bacteroidota bacterium]MBU1678611.1 HAMP domain-containing histidine kinase [Bacteroidota bacterium]MBU2507155.1 HAMP domain-containing histidine kinase [Bacteroidota bacterium]